MFFVGLFFIISLFQCLFQCLLLCSGVFKSRVRIGLFLVKFQPLLVNLTILSPMRTEGNLPRLLTYRGKIVNLTGRIESR